MTADVSIRLRLIDEASKKLSWFEQQARATQQRVADSAKRTAQEAAKAEAHAREEAAKKLSWFERQALASQQRQADSARRAAEEAVRVREASNERIRAGFSRLEQQTKAIQQRMADDAVRAARQEQEARTRAYQQINEARERLSMRSHAQVRDDISHTRAAYQLLSSTGALSWREQVQAAERMRATVRQLTNEMGQLTHAQQAQRALQMGAGVAGGIIGGAAGFAYAAKGPITDALELDRRINYLAVTAYPERDLRGKQLGAAELETAIHKAVDISGGKIDGVTNLLGEMVAAGQMPLAEILKNLPYLAKTAVANDANPQDVGRLANILYSQGFVKNPAELERANNAIVSVGQMSGFEYKNQVMHLPSQLPYAKTAGMSGLKAVRDVAVMNATSNLVMGTPDQAGVATHNALMKMASQDTAKDFDKAGRGDLHDALMKARAKGISAIEFWQRIVEQEIAANPKLKAYKIKLDKAKNQEEAKAILADIEMIGRGSSISRYFQEMRGQTGILGWQNAPYRKKLQDKADKAINGDFTPNENNFDYISKTNVHKIDVLENTYEKQRKHLVDKATPGIANAAEKANSWSMNNPGISQFVPALPWLATGLAGVGGGAYAISAISSRISAKLLATGGAEVAAPSLAARLSPAISRASVLFSELAAGTAAYLTKLPALARAAGTYAAPYAPILARATAVGGVGYAGYQVGGLLNEGLNKAITALSGHEATLGTAIYDLMNYKPEPVEVNTQSHLTVTLAPGLIPTAQSSTSTSTAAKGKNNSIMFTGNRGNIWDDVP